MKISVTIEGIDSPEQLAALATFLQGHTPASTLAPAPAAPRTLTKTTIGKILHGDRPVPWTPGMEVVMQPELPLTEDYLRVRDNDGFPTDREPTVAEKRDALICGIKLGEMKIGQMRGAADQKDFSLAGMSRYQSEKALFSLYYGDGSEAHAIRAELDAAGGTPAAQPVRGRGRPPKNAQPVPPEQEFTAPALTEAVQVVPEAPAPKKAKAVKAPEPAPAPEPEVEDTAEIFDEPEDEPADEVFEDEPTDETFGEALEFEDEVEEVDSQYVVTKIPETVREMSRFADIVKSIAAIHKTRDADVVMRWIEAYAPFHPRLAASLPSITVQRVKGVLAA